MIEGHHRTIFARARFLIPERDRLVSNLLKVVPLRSTIGVAALRDLVTLYLKEKEVEARPGLEPEKYSYLTDSVEQKLRPGFSTATMASN